MPHVEIDLGELEADLHNLIKEIDQESDPTIQDEKR